MPEQWKSLRTKFLLIGLLISAIILGFGMFAIDRLLQLNQVSDDLRDVWLPSTRALGDLNNDTSDYRAAEGDMVLAKAGAAHAAQVGITTKLARSIARAERDFERIPHSDPVRLLYASFATRWQLYRSEAEVTMSSNQDAAIRAYTGTSLAAYNAASDALGALTAHNGAHARQASARVAQAYQEGFLCLLLALVLSCTLLALLLTFLWNSICHLPIMLVGAMGRLPEQKTGFLISAGDFGDEIDEFFQSSYVYRAKASGPLHCRHNSGDSAALVEQECLDGQEPGRRERNFISVIDYKFRTPLAAIDAHAQRLVSMRERIAPDDLARRAARIRMAVQRMTGLMESLLSAARVMSGEDKLKLHPMEFDLRKLLHEVSSFHREASPHAYIEEDFGSNSLSIKGDWKLLFQAFNNLLDNAIKYAPGDVFAEIRAYRSSGDVIVVAITDNGVGVPEAERKNLFIRDYRGGNVSGTVGSGFGLYFAKTVLAMHGGTIIVESTEGQGSCFEVRLPGGEAASASPSAWPLSGDAAE